MITGQEQRRRVTHECHEVISRLPHALQSAGSGVNAVHAVTRADQHVATGTDRAMNVTRRRRNLDHRSRGLACQEGLKLHDLFLLGDDDLPRQHSHVRVCSVLEDVLCHGDRALMVLDHVLREHRVERQTLR